MPVLEFSLDLNTEGTWNWPEKNVEIKLFINDAVEWNVVNVFFVNIRKYENKTKK